MKKYKAKMRFKAVTNAIIMTNRMKGAFKVKSAGHLMTCDSQLTSASAVSSTEPHTDSAHDNLATPIDDSNSQTMDPALESFPLSLHGNESSTTSDAISATQSIAAATLPGTGPVTGTSVRFSANTLPPAKTTVSTSTIKIPDNRTTEEIEKEEKEKNERLEKEREEEEEACHKAAVERKKSKGLIIISAPSDENSIYEEDESYLVACID